MVVPAGCGEARSGVRATALSGGSTVSAAAFEVPPPGAGVKTVISRVPAVTRSLASIAAVSCVAEITAVGRFEPSTRTIDVDPNPVPLTVNTKPGLATGTSLGVSPVVTGTG